MTFGYVTPIDKLHGREKAIFDERDRKLKEARERRASNRKLSNQKEQRPTQADGCYTKDAWAEDRALLASNPSAESGPKAKVGDDSASSSAASPLLLV